ncbi:MAG: hypothetical protein ACLFV3_04415 [Phycisphaeraceae bacterium]
MSQFSPTEHSDLTSPNGAGGPGGEAPRLEQSDEPQSMSLLGGVAGADGTGETDPTEFDDSEKRSLNTNVLIVVLVVAVAAGVLYMMNALRGDLTTDTQAQQVENRVNQALAQLRESAGGEAAAGEAAGVAGMMGINPSALLADTESIIEMFSTNIAEAQVPVNYVQKNPFALALPGGDKPEEPQANNDNREQRLARLRGEFNRLELQTVMGGDTPIAVINGEFLQEGDSIGSFAVAKIVAAEATAILEAEGEQFKIVMKQ